MRLGDEVKSIAFTTWTANEFQKLTGINLYDPSGITKVFKTYGEGETITPTDFEVIIKLAYSALAAAEMPEDAGDDWRPSFTWRGIMNKYPLNSPTIYDDILSAYFDRDIQVVKDGLRSASEEEPKNVSAPNVGQ